jgi:hypothetical protein
MNVNGWPTTFFRLVQSQDDDRKKSKSPTKTGLVRRL